jgi:FkbM family methyltransferase
VKTYKYSARDSKGRIAKGELEATDIAALKNKLRNQGLWLISQNSSQQSLLPFLEGFFDKKIGLKDMVVFSRQFSAMIEAGIAILRVLTVLIQQTENPKLKAILQEIKRDIEQGVPLSESMQKFPEAFDSLYVSMVKAGELGGVLDVVLNRVAGFLESRSKLSNKVRTALTYPASLLVISLLVVWFMLTFILPKFSAIFTSTGGELPAFTQFLINISNVLRSPFILVIIAFIWFAVNYPNATIHSFECNPDMIGLCESRSKYFPNIRLNNAAVSISNTPMTFYKIDQEKTKSQQNIPYYIKKDGNPGASSLFKSLDKVYSQIPIEVRAIRLDNYLKQNNIDYIDLLWMDIQGSELNALKSLGENINKVKMIHTEMPIGHNTEYDGAPKAEEIHSYLLLHKFELVGVGQMDYIYLNTNK